MADRPFACVFDAYGTLLDLGSVVRGQLAGLGERADSLLALWRAKQLEYTWLRTLMGRYVPFDRVTADALDYALEALQLSPEQHREALLGAYRIVACYPEAPAVLRTLRRHGIRTAILSNGNPDLLASAVTHSALQDLLDRILSVDPLRAYKPSPPVYALAAEAFGRPTEEFLFVSGNAWDAAGAAAAGLRTAWINPGARPAERLPATPAMVLASLEDLPRALDLD